MPEPRILIYLITQFLTRWFYVFLNWHNVVALINSLSFSVIRKLVSHLLILFHFFCQVEDYRKWLKLSYRSFAFTSCKAFLKNQKKFGTSLLASFSVWFFKKNISIVIFYYLTKFQCLVAFTSWDIGQYVYCNCLLNRLWRQKFWN